MWPPTPRSGRLPRETIAAAFQRSVDGSGGSPTSSVPACASIMRSRKRARPAPSRSTTSLSESNQSLVSSGSGSGSWSSTPPAVTLSRSSLTVGSQRSKWLSSTFYISRCPAAPARGRDGELGEDDPGDDQGAAGELGRGEPLVEQYPGEGGGEHRLGGRGDAGAGGADDPDRADGQGERQQGADQADPGDGQGDAWVTQGLHRPRPPGGHQRPDG